MPIYYKTGRYFFNFKTSVILTRINWNGMIDETDQYTKNETKDRIPVTVNK